MSARLDHIQNWAELAKEAKWSVNKMAGVCRISVRALELRFRRGMAKSPKEWVTEQRMEQAKPYLEEGFSAKETAERVGYKSTAHFSREFKKYWGFCPREVRFRAPTAGKLRISA